MPEAVAHLAFARIVRELPPVARVLGPAPAPPRPSTLALYYFGALLPDLVTRPFYILYPPLGPYLQVLHAPVCLVLWCVVIARFFSPPLRALAFRAMLAGAATHMSIDLIQRHLAAGYYLWYPFTLERTRGGLVWPEDTLYLTPVLLAIAWAISLARRSRA